MKLLSDSLYKNKIAAPIRELSANALDSHLAAGTQNIPFDIHLPSVSEDYFSIRDYGTGMSRENLETLYTTYGISEKTDSNDLIGCLGIGSKSPFAYTDSFIVISYYNGRKFTYFAGKNQEGIPSLNFVSDESTVEKNGLYIEFVVKENDYYSFWENAKIIYQFFPIKPNITHSVFGDITTDRDVVLQGTGWTIYSYNYSQQSALVMGGISYPVETSYFSDNKTQTWYSKKNNAESILNLYCVINATIGSVDVDISREGLQYTEKTISFIKSIVQSIQNDLQSIVNEKFLACTTRFEAHCIYNEIFGSDGILNNFTKLKEYIKFPFGITNGIARLNNDKIKNVRYFKNGKVIKNSGISIAVSVDKKTEFYLNNIKSGGFSRCKAYSENNQDKQVIILTIPENNEDIIKDCIDELGITREQLKNIDTLPKAQRATSTKSVSRHINNYICGNRSSYKTFVWEKTNVDYEAGGYYVKLSNYTPYKNDNKRLRWHSFPQSLETLSSLGWFNEKIYGFCDYTIKKFIKNNPKWIEFTSYVEELLKEKIQNIKIWTDLDNIPSFFKDIKKSDELDDDVKEIIEILKNKNAIDLVQIECLFDSFQLGQPQVSSNSVQPKIDKILKKYPLLNHLIYTAPTNHIVDYIKLVNKQGE
jgi:hypothetical protein